MEKEAWKKKRVVTSIKDNTGTFCTNKNLLPARSFLMMELTMICLSENQA